MSQARPVPLTRCARAALAGIVVLACSLAAAPALAFQGPWVAPIDLSAIGRDAAAPQLVFAADGTATAIWTRSNGTHDIVQASTRPPGGTFGMPVDLSAVGGNATAPQLAAAADGTTTAIWTRSNGSRAIVQTSTRPPGGAFAPPADLSATDTDATAPQIAVGADGTTAATWRQDDGSYTVVRASTRPPGGAFAPPVPLSTTGEDSFAPQVAVAADGTTTAIWTRSNGTNDIVQASTRPPGGTFSSPVDLSGTDQGAETPQIAIAADGAATAIWTRFNGVQISTRPPGGTFGPPVDLSGAIADAPQIAVAADGTATATWIRAEGGNDIVQARTRQPGGTFGPSINLSALGQPARAPQLVFAADGTTTATWSRYNGTNFIVQASTRPSGGAFGPPVDLSVIGADADAPQIAVAQDGTTTAVWTRSNGANAIVQVALTANPPVLRSAPAITGSPALGATLGCDGGSWSGAASIATSWLRGGTQIAAGASYQVAPADQGAALVCRALAINTFGSAESMSTPLSIGPLAAHVAPPADRTAPALTVLTKTKLTRVQFLRNGVSVRISADEPTAVLAELVARAKGAKISAVPYNLVLGSRTARRVQNSVTVKIKPNRTLVGKARRFSIRLRLTATDAAGNQRVTGKTIRVAG